MALPRPGITQSHGLHRSEAQGVDAALGDFLNWQAALKVVGFVELVSGVLPCRRQGLIEPGVLFLAERAIDVVIRPVHRVAVARRPKRDVHIDGFGIDDRADRIVKEEPLAARELYDRSRQGIDE